MPQITPITSEALQATIRRLLPSQRGFGEDLEATNLITPIIDLTPSAEGSQVRADLQTAIAFDSGTYFNVNNGNNIVANTPGFFQFRGNVSIEAATGTTRRGKFLIFDATTSKEIVSYQAPAAGSDLHLLNENFDFTVFLRPADYVQITCDSTAFISGNVRQIADVNGNLINPSGFDPQ